MKNPHNIIKNKKIVINGATGFLGSHLLPTLIKQAYDIIILKPSFSNTWRIQNVLSQIKNYDIDKVDIKKYLMRTK